MPADLTALVSFFFFLCHVVKLPLFNVFLYVVKEELCFKCVCIYKTRAEVGVLWSVVASTVRARSVVAGHGGAAWRCSGVSAQVFYLNF